MPLDDIAASEPLDEALELRCHYRGQAAAVAGIPMLPCTASQAVTNARRWAAVAQANVTVTRVSK